MRMLAFARRNWKEMLRDPLTLAFGAGFPLVLILLFSLIQKNVPVPLFALEKLTPGMIVFGQLFLALFSAQLISRDRSSALMMRLLTAPMTAADFILGYVLPLLPLAAAQGVLCLLAAFALGLAPGWNALIMLLTMLPGALCNIALGLICGSLLTERQVGGICGALLTNLGAWLSGAWFDLSLVGVVFEAVAHALPYANAVDAGRAVLAGSFSAATGPLTVVWIYALVLGTLAVVIFSRKMRYA